MPAQRSVHGTQTIRQTGVPVGQQLGGAVRIERIEVTAKAPAEAGSGGLGVENVAVRNMCGYLSGWGRAARPAETRCHHTSSETSASSARQVEFGRHRDPVGQLQRTEESGVRLDPEVSLQEFARRPVPPVAQVGDLQAERLGHPVQLQ